jgi:hypothetical protein
MKRLLAAVVFVVAALVVPSTLLALPDFGEPKRIDEPVFDESASAALRPEVVANGSDRAIFWTNRVEGVRGIIADSDGSPDPTSLVALPFIQHNREMQAVAFGDRYMLVWEQDPSEDDDSSYGIVLDENLEPVGTRFRLSSQDTSAEDPDVACTDTRCIVVWSKWESDGSAIHAQRFDADADEGVSATGDPLTLWSGREDSDDPSVATNGDGFLVAWGAETDEQRIYVTRLDAEGAVIDESPVEVSSPGEHPHQTALASDGRDYLLAWSEEKDESYDVRVAHILAATGQVAESIPDLVTDAPGHHRGPDVAHDGSKYVVTWTEQGNRFAYMTRIGGPGEVESPDGVPLYEDTELRVVTPSVTGTADGAFVVWRDDRRGWPSVYGTPLDSRGRMIDPNGLAMTREPNAQEFVAVAGSDTGFLAVWADSRNPLTDEDVYAMRFDVDGTPLDEEPFVICDDYASAGSVAVASDGCDYFVVWYHYSNSRADEILGTHIRAETGEVVTHCGDTLSQNPNEQNKPDVASNGDGYLVAWSEGHDASDIVAQYVPGLDGNPEDASVATAVVASSRSQSEPAIATNGDTYLVAWDEKYEEPRGRDIVAARVDGRGTPLDDSVATLARGNGTQTSPDATSDRRRFLVIWRDSLDDDNDGVWANFVSASGEPSDNIALDLIVTEGTLDSPVIDFTGDQYVALWTHSAPDEPGSKTMGIALERDGTLIDAQPGVEVADAIGPALATNPRGMSIAAWSVTPRDLGGEQRAEVSFFGADGDGDHVADTVDNCPDTPNPDQVDDDDDDIGDACDDSVDTGGGPSPWDIDPGSGSPRLEGASGCGCSTDAGEPAPIGAGLLCLLGLVCLRARRRS